MPIIQFKDIEKKYDKNSIITNFNLDIEKGEFLTVIGSSGCGKTTLLKMINGLLLPDSGSVLVNQKDIKNEDLIALRRSIGYCIQGSVLFPHMSVEENISYVPNLLNHHNKKKTHDAVTKWMKIVGLTDDMRMRYPSELSGGQQQRVGIARALASSPDILLMDEPFGAVDEITRVQLQKEIKEIHHKTGITIIFVTHDISEALLLGTKVLVLDQGAVQQYDTPEHVAHMPANSFVEKLLNGKGI
ncbi:ATP-binding cassette domain-containing protein [uncultured Robinsoniella sp.]|uniref:ATP-binding cassette domain-containing protein n=1 Tax=uncultured Robinsoniella sp. TaxID=904190 RepID=UPI00374E630A